MITQLPERKASPGRAGLAGRADLRSKRGRMPGLPALRRTRKSQRMRPPPMTSGDILERLGLTAAALSGGSLSVRSPIDGAEIARIRETPAADMPAIIERAHTAFLAWREVPAPRRGELVRLLGEELRTWNAALALVCGDPVIWKPSEKTPLSALATMKILERAVERFGPDAPEGLAQLIIGGPAVGEALTTSKRVPIVSATGSTRMGSIVGPKVAARFGRPILELGGNNAMIVAPSPHLHMAVRAIVFSAVGTAGQRCTSLRRVIAHRSIRADLTHRLVKTYAGLPIGDPRTDGTLVGPLIDHA